MHIILSSCKLIAEARLGHTKLRKWNHFHPIPLISQTRRHVHFFSITSSSYSHDPRARVTPNRVHQPISSFPEEKRLSRPNARGVVHSFISASRLSRFVVELSSPTSSYGRRTCTREAREPTAAHATRSFVLVDRTQTTDDLVGLSGHLLV